MTTKNNIPQWYKQTELGIIPREWEVKRIKDICEVDAKSLSAKTSPDYEFEYISLSDVGSDLFDISTSHQIFRTAPSRARRIVSKGDVVISTVRPNLQGFFLVKEDKKDLIASTGFAVLTPTECDSQYLLSCFFSQIVSKQFYSLMVGSNYPAVNSSDVAKLKLPVPPLAEQKKIAEILGVWDEAIEKQNLLIEKLELRKRALMQRLLTGKTRLHGFTEPWQKVKLGEIGRFISGCVFNENEQGGKVGFPFFKVSDMNLCGNEVRMTKSNNYVTQEQIERLNYIVVKDEAIIFAKVGAAIALERKRYAKDFIIDNNMLAYVPDTNIWYMKYWFDSIKLSKYIQVGALPSYNASDLAIIKLNLPSLSEQKAIAEVLTMADNEIATHRKKLDALRLQKRGLMQQLLTGKTRVKI
jgi:type I restriction enzyme S subunit